MQSRYYDSSIGRFITIDDYTYLDPDTINGVNLYAYCGNNPVMNIDPTGHFFFTALIVGAVIGATVGFGTTVYEDYKDDGEVFNGSVEWYEYAGSTVTGAVLGAGVGGIVSSGGAVLTSAISSTANKLVSDLFAYTLTGTSFGTWEDYAVSFISGGIVKGSGMGKTAKNLYDVAGRPLVNQIVKIGTNRQDSFNRDKYLYDVITRGITTFAPSPWKAFYRGLSRSIWDLNR